MKNEEDTFEDEEEEKEGTENRERRVLLLVDRRQSMTATRKSMKTKKTMIRKQMVEKSK